MGTNRHNGRINIDTMALLLRLPEWDRIDDINQDHYYQSCKGCSEDEREECEQAARDEIYHAWYDAVLSAFETLCEAHSLRCKPLGKDRPYEHQILPVTSWRDAARLVMSTINGVGQFEFATVREFIDSSSAPNVRGVVFNHLHWIKYQPDVYGTSSAHALYQRAWSL